ncbi:hypothetical protein [Cupriavidus necator]
MYAAGYSHGGQTRHLLEEALSWHAGFRDHGTMQPAQPAQAMAA